MISPATLARWQEKPFSPGQALGYIKQMTKTETLHSYFTAPYPG